jgi:hypothetical protein
LIRNWSLPSALTNLSSASFNTGSSGGKKVIFTLDGSPTTYTSDTPVSI